jgi:hypothetical protein
MTYPWLFRRTIRLSGSPAPAPRVRFRVDTDAARGTTLAAAPPTLAPVVGIPDLWLTVWLPPVFGRRTEPFRVWGPTGTKEMMSYLEKAYQADIQIRVEDEKLPLRGAL